MKSLLTITLVMLFAVSSIAQEPKTETRQAPWFDVKTCELCKSMSQHEGLMDNLKWETHVILEGLLSVAVVPEQFKPQIAASKKDMKATMARIQSGEKVKCCGYCQSMGGLLKSGAKLQEIATAAGDVTLVTSADPQIIEQIHAHAKRTISETKKMMNEHAQHDHQNRKKGE